MSYPLLTFVYFRRNFRTESEFLYVKHIAKTKEVRMEKLSYVFLEHEDWPEWFSLDFLPPTETTVPRLLLGIAEGPLRRFVTDIIPKYRPFEVYKKILEDHHVQAEFSFDVDKPWGFGGVMEPYRQSGRVGEGFLEYAISIPQIEKDVGKCEECGDCGKDEENNWCLYCSGTGRKTVMEWDAADRIAATLCVLGLLLDKPDKNWLAGIETKRKQLLSIQLSWEPGCSYIGAMLAKPFGDCLRLISGRELPMVKEATKSTYLRMFPKYDRFGDYNYRASVRDNGQLIIDVPGDACGLYVDGMSRSLKESSGPMGLDCHNVDGAHQQLALLAGLAALCGMVRKKLYPFE